MAVTQLTSPKEFELAKIRITAILNKNNKSTFVQQLTTYPAIAAINSKLSEPLVATSDTEDDTTIYSSITDLLNLYTSDIGYFKIVTSKEMMLAMTNAATPIAWDDTDYLASWVVKLNGKLVALESTKAVIAYAAALEALGGNGEGATALANSSGSNANHEIFKCILGELNAGTTCPVGVAKWTDNKLKALLSLPVMFNNELFGTPDGTAEYGVDTLDGDDITNEKAILSGLTPVVNGYWADFFNFYPNLKATFANDKVKFFNNYNKMEFKRAVTPEQYASFHTSIYDLNEMRFVGELFKDYRAKLINEGIIKFSEANDDLETSGNKYIDAAGFRKFGELLPLPTDLNESIWSEVLSTTWFPSFARSSAAGDLIKDGAVTFAQLNAIQAAVVADAGSGIYGTGNNGSGATAANFFDKFINNPHALEQIKKGITVNMMCAGGGASIEECPTTHSSKLVGNTEIENHEFSTIYDCALSEPVANFVTSNIYYWTDRDSMFGDAVAQACAEPLA